jgi:hypothetical protein
VNDRLDDQLWARCRSERRVRELAEDAIAAGVQSIGRVLVGMRAALAEIGAGFDDIEAMSRAVLEQQADRARRAFEHLGQRR